MVAIDWLRSSGRPSMDIGIPPSPMADTETPAMERCFNACLLESVGRADPGRRIASCRSDPFRVGGRPTTPPAWVPVAGAPETLVVWSRLRWSDHDEFRHPADRAAVHLRHRSAVGAGVGGELSLRQPDQRGPHRAGGGDRGGGPDRRPHPGLAAVAVLGIRPDPAD